MKSPTLQRTELVSIVIPCRNEEHSIGLCLDSVVRQTMRDIEILVVDGGSSDRTREIVAERARTDSRLRLIDNPKRVIPAALNLGLDEAKGTWLVRIDAHSTVSETYVEDLIRLLRTGAGGVGGSKLGIGTSPTGKAIAAAMRSKAGVGGSAYHHASSARYVDHVPFGAYPVALARSIGGWNESLSVNEDYEFDIRVRKAGHRLLLDPSIVIGWENRQTFTALARQYHRYGRGKTQVIRLHPTSTKLRHLAAPLFLLLVVAMVIPPGWARLAIGRRLMATSYMATVCSAAQFSGRDLPLRQRWRVAASLMVMHISWGTGFWRGVCDLIAGRHAPVLVDSDRLNPVDV